MGHLSRVSQRRMHWSWQGCHATVQCSNICLTPHTKWPWLSSPIIEAFSSIKTPFSLLFGHTSFTLFTSFTPSAHRRYSSGTVALNSTFSFLGVTNVPRGILMIARVRYVHTTSSGETRIGLLVPSNFISRKCSEIWKPFTTMFVNHEKTDMHKCWTKHHTTHSAVHSPFSNLIFVQSSTQETEYINEKIIPLSPYLQLTVAPKGRQQYNPFWVTKSGELKGWYRFDTSAIYIYIYSGRNWNVIRPFSSVHEKRKCSGEDLSSCRVTEWC